MDGGWLDSLVCPIDRASLSVDVDVLHCTQCGRSYPVIEGIPNFRRAVPLAGSAAWTAAQDYELAYWADGGQQELVGAREARLRRAAAGLSRLFDVHGPQAWRRRVLHIGPAGAGEVHYLDAVDRYAAEPLACRLHARGLLHQNGVHWVAAMGEHLPFRDHFFSLILVPNVIDHVADPSRLLAEARRCLLPTGRLWVSCHVSSPLLNPLFRGLHRLRVGYFAGHLWYFSAAGLNRLCTRAGFRSVWSRIESLDASTLLSDRPLRRRIKHRVLAASYLLLEPSP